MTENTKMCPFCKDQPLEHMPTPDNCDSYKLIGANSKTNNTVVSSGIFIDIYVCPKCDSIFPQYHR